MKIAIQSKGRLSLDSIELLTKAGFEFQKTDRSLSATVNNFPLEILFLRSGDIPEIVADGIADIGICGQNTLVESGYKLNEILPLGFGKCTLCIASPEHKEYNGMKNKKIATSYPRILESYLSEKDTPADLVDLSGSVEIAPKLNIADMICDLVSTGSTLKNNGLCVREIIFKSQAVLIAHPHLSEENIELLEKIVMRMESVIRAKKTKYIMMNAPKKKIQDISNILPSLDSPTITPLSNTEMVSIATVIQEDEFWETIDKLKEKGASGILVMPIEKVIT